MEFFSVFFKYVLIHWGVGILAMLSQDGNAISDLPVWIACNIIVNVWVFIFSAKGFHKFVFKSPRLSRVSRACLSVLCGIGVSLFYLLVTFVIARLF